MHTLDPTPLLLPERAGYFEVSGAHLYTMLHEADNPVARVLLIGPFASERHHAYLPWVRWARYLASRHIEVLRYDYRGIGESTGNFAELNFEDWMDDVEQLAAWLRSQSPALPLILHGLELGAVLAGRAFDAGLGNGLLLWSPPASANAALRSTLLSWVTLQQLCKRGDERKPASHYIRQLEETSSLEVEGYEWSSALWHKSHLFDLPAALLHGGAAVAAYKRPVRVVSLGRNAAPLVKGGLPGYEEAKDFSWLFGPNYGWIASTFAPHRESTQ